jgi:cell division protein FtsQ
MSIDPRLIERRREVAEDRARRSVSRLVRLMVVLGVVGAGVWLALSPLLSVKEVITSGIVASSGNSALVEAGVLAGTPMILIRSEQVVAGLEQDPWVREAAVELEWPNRVVVRVEERVPVAWVETSQGWEWRAVDGVALPSPIEPDDTLPRISFPALSEEEAAGSPQLFGALEFAAELAPDLAAGTLVWEEGNGELWAEVSGYAVRLGRPVEMEAKARSLEALLADRPRRGSTLTLIAPTHPAVSPSGSSEGESDGKP